MARCMSNNNKINTMKKHIIMTGLSLFSLLSPVFSQDAADSTGLPGDNFDLQGALEIFKSSTDLEAFEKSLNSESSQVNNLDLDGDNQVDYIRVTDRMDGKNHAIVLQVAVNENETQDVAAIVIEQTADSTAQLQIIGNENLYGDELVVEPYDEVAEKSSTGPSSMMYPTRIIIVNVWAWPTVRWIYRPVYVVYVSPYHWRRYPVYWHPWHPVAWNVHYRRVHHYHPMYHVAPACHLAHAHGMYVKNVSVSKTVSIKYAAPHAAYKTKKAAAQPVGNGHGNAANPSKTTVKQQHSEEKGNSPKSAANGASVEKKTQTTTRTQGTNNKSSQGRAAGSSSKGGGHSGNNGGSRGGGGKRH